MVEGVGSIFLFLYLAWLDSTFYGELMYAAAAGGVITKVVQYGLYYPLVGDLSAADSEKAPDIINRVNVIKLGLFAPAMLVILTMSLFKGFSAQMAWIVFLVCLGFGLEAIAETFFADLRVRGVQGQEAVIRSASSGIAYLYGALTALLGLNPVIVSLFKLLSSVIRLALCLIVYVRTHSPKLLTNPQWAATGRVFRSATVFALIEILGVLYNRSNVFFLEDAVGVKGVAFYYATLNIVDPICILGSEQLLGWVVFPLLATLWWQQRERVGPVVRSAAQWLAVLSYPVMFVLYIWSDVFIGFIYPKEYLDAAWMQKYLVWTILLSFESNIFCYLMMVAGAARVLLLFVAVATGANLVLNLVLVYPFGLLGACWVIVLTKLIMAALTMGYCQVRFGFMKAFDFVFPLVLAALSLGVFFLLEPHMLVQRAVLVTFLFYCLVLWRFGPLFMGRIPGRDDPAPGV